MRAWSCVPRYVCLHIRACVPLSAPEHSAAACVLPGRATGETCAVNYPWQFPGGYCAHDACHTGGNSSTASRECSCESRGSQMVKSSEARFPLCSLISYSLSTSLCVQCTFCYDEIKETQDLKICSQANSLSPCSAALRCSCRYLSIKEPNQVT